MGLGEKVKGLRNINWQLWISHRDVKFSTGNAVDDVIITMSGVRWELDLSP